MSRTATIVLALAVGLAAGIPLGGRLMPLWESAAATTTTAFSAVPDAIGAQDVSGPYEVVAGWPKDLSTLPGHEKWTYGGARGIFAESPNRVYLLGGGELPNIPRPQTRLLPEIGPNVQFPLAGLPWRNANTASPPGGGGSARTPRREWSSGEARRRRIASSAWTPAGSTVSSSLTRRATSSKSGRSGTKCSSVHSSTMLPCASTTTRPALPAGVDPELTVRRRRRAPDAPFLFRGLCPTSPPGGAAVFALRHGSPPTGNCTFGPISGGRRVWGPGC